MSKVILRLFWFCFTSLCDWPKNFAPLYHKKKDQNQNNVTFSLVFSRAWHSLSAFNSDVRFERFDCGFTIPVITKRFVEPFHCHSQLPSVVHMVLTFLSGFLLWPVTTHVGNLMN